MIAHVSIRAASILRFTFHFFALLLLSSVIVCIKTMNVRLCRVQLIVCPPRWANLKRHLIVSVSCPCPNLIISDLPMVESNHPCQCQHHITKQSRATVTDCAEVTISGGQGSNSGRTYICALAGSERRAAWPGQNNALAGLSGEQRVARA